MELAKANNNGKLMRYDEAIDLAFKLSNSDEDNWTYTVEINAASGMARVAVFDETKIQLGYL
tara:strand:+ start:321 stop:506 length:186 start_codon:yes stop_codon:yes gene_type:complete